MARLAQETVDALFHHLCGLVGKRDRQNGVTRHALLDQMRYTIGDDAGLARARARQDKQRPFGGDNGFALPFVQFVEDWH